MSCGIEMRSVGLCPLTVLGRSLESQHSAITPSALWLVASSYARTALAALSASKTSVSQMPTSYKMWNLAPLVALKIRGRVELRGLVRQEAVLVGLAATRNTRCTYAAGYATAATAREMSQTESKAWFQNTIQTRTCFCAVHSLRSLRVLFFDIFVVRHGNR